MTKQSKDNSLEERFNKKFPKFGGLKGTPIYEFIQKELDKARKEMIEEMEEYNNKLYKDNANFFVHTFLQIFKEHLKSKSEK